MSPDSTQSQSASGAATEVAVETAQVVGSACGSCHCPLPSGARFCPECGASAAGGACPACNAAAEGQDFCQSCGFWLLPGNCRFCYEPVPEGAAFCPSCGCDQAGIACPGCGTRNFFDFCTTCGSALSEAAAQELAEIANDPLLSAALEKLASVSNGPDETGLAAAAPSPLAARPARRPLFSQEHREAIRALSAGHAASPANAAVPGGTRPVHRPPASPALELEGVQRGGVASQADIERDRKLERQKLGNAKLVVERAALDELLAAAATKSFLTQQQARRFHMALLAKLKEISGGPRGWLCNKYSYLHLDGPNGCSAPQFGGVWVP